MAVDFPSSPTPGQAYTQGGVTWTFDGVKWVAQGTGTGIYLPLAGGVMTGDITLKGDPTAALQPVTKQMLDARALAMNDNRIINGDMRIDQRNNGASGSAAQYTVDRWAFGATLATKGTWSQQVNAPPPSEGFPYSLTFVSNSSYSAVAADQFIFFQPIEANQISDFQFGTANAKSVTLSFWAYASVSGSFSGAIQNYAQTRSYPFSYSVPAVNTWTKIAVTIPGDTGGTWVMSGNGGGCYVIFDLGSGATFRGPANAWASTTYNGVTGSKSIVATNGATFYLTGVKLEIGSVATPFNRQSLAKSQADCERYFKLVNTALIVGYNTAGNPVFTSYPIAMRAAPTATFSAFSFNNASAPAMDASTTSVVNLRVSITATALGYGQGNVALNAEL